MVIVPNIMYLDYTITNDKYYTNYVFTEIINKIVLTLNENKKELSNIVKKYFEKWKNESFVETYNDLLLVYYIDSKNVNDKTRSDILSKTSVVNESLKESYRDLYSGLLESVSQAFL